MMRPPIAPPAVRAVLPMCLGCLVIAAIFVALLNPPPWRDSESSSPASEALGSPSVSADRESQAIPEASSPVPELAGQPIPTLNGNSIIISDDGPVAQSAGSAKPSGPPTSIALRRTPQDSAGASNETFPAAGRENEPSPNRAPGAFSLGSALPAVSIMGESPQLTWAAPDPITYGTPLSATQLNATAGQGIAGQFVYNPPLDTVLDAGLNQNLSVTFVPDDPSVYDAETTTVLLNVFPAALTIEATDVIRPPSTPNPTLMATYIGLVNGDQPSDLDVPPVLSTTATQASAPGDYPIQISGAADANYTIQHVDGILSIPSSPDPNLVWPVLNPITYGEPLSGAQFAVTHAAGTPGEFRYYPPLGTVLDAGMHTLSVAFVPTDPNQGQAGASWVTLEVTKAPLIIRADDKVGVSVDGNGGGADVVNFVTVGNPNNAAQPGPGVGSVDRPFEIASHEITNSLYAEFLNAVGGNDNTNASLFDPRAPLYNFQMGSEARGGIVRQGEAPNLTYSVKPNMGNKPVNFVSFWDACRFCNWLHNGRPSGAQDSSTTEDGAYDLTDPDAFSINAIFRKPGARFFIPNESEWHKAAYYDPNRNGGSYWLYPTQSDSLPTPALADAQGNTTNPGANVVNYNRKSDWDSNGNGRLENGLIGGRIGQEDGNVLTVGSTGGISFYGVSDMGGNVQEWTDSPINVWARMTRGGSWNSPDSFLKNDYQFPLSYAAEVWDMGFRIARPDPSQGQSLIPELTLSYFGLVNDDPPTSLNVAPQLTTAANAASPQGDYDIIVFGAQSSNYDITFTNGTLRLNQKQNPNVHWLSPSDLVYGTPLSGEQLNATATLNEVTIPGTFTYEPALGAVLSPGDHELIVTFQPTDALTYNPIVKKVSLTVNPAPLTIRADDKNREVNTANPALTVTYSGFVNGDTPDSLWVPVDVSTTASMSSPTGTYPIVPQEAFSPNYAITFENGTLNVLSGGQLIPTLVWNPASLSYGTPLGDGQLNALEVSGVPGTFTYDPPAGTLLNAGPSQLLSTTFTPNDPNAFATVSSVALIDVAKAPLTVRAADTSKMQGTPNPALNVLYDGFVANDSAADLNAQPLLTTTATVDSPVGTYPINVSIGSDNNYAFTTVDGTLTIQEQGKTMPSLFWSPASASFVYGTPLGPQQLNANELNGVPGTFTYNPPAGTLLDAGNSQVISATFTPDDLENFETANVIALVDVAKAPLTASANDSSKVRGAPNPSFSVRYDGFVGDDTAADLDSPPVLTTTATLDSTVGTYPINLSIGGDNNYDITTVNGTLTVEEGGKLEPFVVWEPGALVYGTALGAAQLNALEVTGVPGSFTYDPPTGTLLDVGAGQTLTSTFLPDDTNVYATVTTMVTVDVNKAPLTIRVNDLGRPVDTPNPSFTASYEGFVQGDTVDVLDDVLELTTAAVEDSPPGDYPITGSIGEDNHYAITIVDGTLTITGKLKPDAAWETPAAITYGTSLSDAQLNATVEEGVEGIWSYDPPAGTFLDAGSHDLMALFTPTDNDTYDPVSLSVSLTVNKAPLTIRANDLGRPVNSPNPQLTASYEGFVQGDTVDVLDDVLELTTTAVEDSPPGEYPITGSIDADTNYVFTIVDGTLTISEKTTPKVNWTAPNPIRYGTALGEDQLNATVEDEVEGVWSYDPPAGTILTPGTHELKAMFTPTDTSAYNIASIKTTISAGKAFLTIRIDAISRPAGSANPELTASYAGFVLDQGPADLAGELELSTPATEESPPGNYPITGTIVADPHYAITVLGNTLTVEEKIVPEINWSAPDPVTYGSRLSEAQLNATVADGIEGQLTYDPKLGALLNAGTQTLSVVFTPSNPLAFESATATVSLAVQPAALTIRALDQERPANTENPSFEVTYEGFVNEEDASALTTPPTVATDATVESPPGEYAIFVSGAEAPNYTISLVDGTLTITEPEPEDLPQLQIEQEGDSLILSWNEHREGLQLWVSTDLEAWEAGDLRALEVEEGKASIVFSLSRLSMTSDHYHFRLQESD